MLNYLRKRGYYVSLFILFIIVSDFALASPGCDLCAQTGDCSRAYHNQNGQFCGNLISQKPCCCPSAQTAHCKQDSLPYSCMCLPANNGGGSHHSTHHHYDDDYIPDASDGLGFVLFIIVLCVCCSFCPKQSGATHGESGAFIPEAVPVTYGSSEPPPPTAPAWGSWSSRRRNDGGGGFGSALGGFAAGTMIGSMFGGGGGGGRHHHHGRHGHHGHHGHHSNDFAFAGDVGSGVGGGGFGGDTGGGGAFAGDS